MVTKKLAQETCKQYARLTDQEKYAVEIFVSGLLAGLRQKADKRGKSPLSSGQKGKRYDRLTDF